VRLTRYRLRALARPARRTAVGLVLAAATFVGVRGSLARLEASRAAWGERRTVVVARRDLRPGEAVRAEVVRVEAWPVAIAADDALTPDALDGAGVVATTVLAGEAVRRGHLSTDAAARMIGPGRRGVTVAAPSGVSLTPGARVDVVDAGSGAVVARAAIVAGTTATGADTMVLVAVTEDELGPTARAAAAGAAVLAIAPGA
jgi:Flp pilus assembly protein CpaB